MCSESSEETLLLARENQERLQEATWELELKDGVSRGFGQGTSGGAWQKQRPWGRRALALLGKLSGDGEGQEISGRRMEMLSSVAVQVSALCPVQSLLLSLPPGFHPISA